MAQSFRYFNKNLLAERIDPVLEELRPLKSVCQWWEAVPALSGENCSTGDGRLEDIAILILVAPAVL